MMDAGIALQTEQLGTRTEPMRQVRPQIVAQQTDDHQVFVIPGTSQQFGGVGGVFGQRNTAWAGALIDGVSTWP